jgi:hypothetical protein
MKIRSIVFSSALLLLLAVGLYTLPAKTQAGSHTSAPPLLMIKSAKPACVCTITAAKPVKNTLPLLDTAFVNRLSLATSYFNYGQEIEKRYDIAEGKKYAAGRKEFVVYYLRSLKMLVDLGIPSPEKMPKQPLPTVYDISARNAMIATAYEVQKVTNDARGNEWRFFSNVASFREEVALKVYLAYTAPPYRTDELRKLATTTLKDRALVRSLTSRVDAYVAEHPASSTK